jgi:hypothetical protein
MSHYLIAQLDQRLNITVEARTEVVSIDGENALESIRTSAYGALPRERSADALFIMIGAKARTDWLPEALQRDLRDSFLLAATFPTGKNPAHPSCSKPACLGYFARAMFAMTRSSVWRAA